MSAQQTSEKTLRERFSEAASNQGIDVERLWRKSLRGSDKIEDIRFSTQIYESDDPADYPRVSPSRR